MSDTTSKTLSVAQAVPPGFGTENEHPMLTMPFSIVLGNEVYTGQRISVTHIEIEADPQSSLRKGTTDLATIQFPFQDYAITMAASVMVASARDGKATLLFSEPTGPHLAQLRYIMNSFIAGDLVTLKGMMAYTGPTQPKAPKGAEAKPAIRDRMRSIAVAVISMSIALVAATFVFDRYTTAYELHPVFIEQDGLSMQATVAGQVTFIDADAQPGDVAYTIAAVTGDVLSFQMPAEGVIKVSDSVYQGATVLPDDLIMTIFDNTPEVRLRTMMSIEGLARALSGDNARIELNDGRKMPVKVQVRDTTRAAALKGDLFVPVDLTVKGQGLTPSDINKSARLRLSKSLLGLIGYKQEN